MEDESLPFNSSELQKQSSFTLDSHSSAISRHISKKQNSRTTKSSQAILSKLTINKLRFDESHLYGRGDDLKKLQDVFEKSKESRQLLLLRGEAGTGKSALSAQLKSTVRRSGGIYVTGKFDYQQQETPLFGISMACQDLCRTILSLRPDDSSEVFGSSRTIQLMPSFDEVQSKLRSEIGAETQVLATLAPRILDILGEDHAVDNETFDFEKSKGLFHSAFRRWIRAVGSFGPLVVVLDDLQLADVASLDFIQSMLDDKDNPGLMVICTYRTEEVDDKHPLLETIRRIEENANEGAGITAIDVENLSIEHLNSMFRDVLNLHGDTAYGLASCVHRKTMGNAFFAIQLLKSLSERGLLTYNLGSSSWTWDIKSIERVVVATENVVDLLKSNLEKLPKDVCELIPVIASLGSTFSSTTASYAIDYFHDKVKSMGKEERGIPQKIKEKKLNDTKGGEILDLCLKEGFIEEQSESRYRWIHDKIQEAVLALMKSANLSNMQYQLGELLLEEWSETEIRANIFIIVDLLGKNRGSLPDEGPKEKIRMARLCVKAGDKAIRIASFSTIILTEALIFFPMITGKNTTT